MNDGTRVDDETADRGLSLAAWAEMVRRARSHWRRESRPTASDLVLGDRRRRNGLDDTDPDDRANGGGAKADDVSG
jgi:hypothetical protein